MSTQIQVVEESSPETVTIVVGSQKKHLVLPTNEVTASLRDLLNAVYAEAGVAGIPEGEPMSQGKVTIVARDPNSGITLTQQPTRDVTRLIPAGSRIVVGKDFFMGGIQLVDVPVGESITIVVGSQKKHLVLDEGEANATLRDLLNAVYAEAGVDGIPEGEPMSQGKVTVVARDAVSGITLTQQPTRDVTRLIPAGSRIVVGKDFFMGQSS